jgi:hypothetical protein
MKGVPPWLVRWACRTGTPTIDFFLTVHYCNFFFPIPQQAGQAVVLGRLSLSMCLWLTSKDRGLL